MHSRAGHLSFRSFPRLLVGPKTNSRAVSAGDLCFLYKKKFPQGRAYAAPLSYSRFSYFLVLSRVGKFLLKSLCPKILSRAGLIIRPQKNMKKPHVRKNTLTRGMRSPCSATYTITAGRRGRVIR